MTENNIEINVKTGEVTKFHKEPEIEEVEIDVAQEYHKLTNQLIRRKYTLDQELSIKRQRETKPDEFQEYFDYCEECKAKAREELDYEEDTEG